MPTRRLELSDVGADGMKVEIESLGVLLTKLANFLNDGVDHSSSPKTSSGEQSSGHAKPCASTNARILCRVAALLMWVKFQVTTKSMPFSAAVAT
jgi:hypothetical protein